MESPTSAFMVFLPGFQLAGHTSPCWSVNWNAWTKRRVSSTERPTGMSLMVIWRKLPALSMMNKPRKATPSSSLSTPYLREISWVLSANRGMFILPKPPCLRGVVIQAKWEYSESVLQPTTSQPMLRNSSTRSE